MPENPQHQDPLVTKWTAQPGMYGEDLGPNLFLDQPGPPSQRSTARRHFNQYRRAGHDARQAQYDEDLDLAAEMEEDADAYQRVMDAKRQRRPVSVADKTRAARYVRTQGLVPSKSSAERYVDQYRRNQQGWKPHSPRS